MTLRSQTLPELEKTFHGGEYPGPSCFHLILWTQSCSHLGIDTAVSTSMTISKCNLPRYFWLKMTFSISLLAYCASNASPT